MFFQDLSALIFSDDFARRARHPEFPGAFTRRRKLPLPTLIGVLLSMRAGSQQSLLDGFFGLLRGNGSFLREISDRAFAKARSHLHQPALVWLNDWLIARAESAGLVHRWFSRRVVAADASVLMPAMRASASRRGACLARPAPVRDVPARG